MVRFAIFISFFFNDTATTEIYTLSLHDALPIYGTYPIVKGIDEAMTAHYPFDKLEATENPKRFLSDNHADRSLPAELIEPKIGRAHV